MSSVHVAADRSTWPDLANLLAGWLPSQRWFQGKARTVTGVEVDDVVVLPGQPPVADAFVTVRYGRGPPERYQVPLAAGDGLGAVAGTSLGDAPAGPASARTLGLHTLADTAVATVNGSMVHGAPVGDPPALPAAARPLGAEQSNTSVVFGDVLLLKVFRKLEPGVNPDVELTRGLTEQGFPHVPPQAGALLLDGDGGPSALAVLSSFRSGGRDGWEIACDEASAARRGEEPTVLSGRAGELGRVVGELHRALWQRFGGRHATPDDVAAWVRDMHRQLDAVLATFEERTVGDLAVPLSDRTAALRDRIDGLAGLPAAGTLIRTHGDLHLGQVLLDPTHGWQVLDFEGEPARPLAERRLPHSPVRDVAGMLRSFDYAAAHGAPSAEASGPEPVERWRDDGRAALLAGYFEVCGDSGLPPPDRASRETLLAAFELDKAVYELGYELANRPAWTRIPIGGILRLLEQGAVPSTIDP